MSSEKKQTRGSDPGALRAEFNSVEGERSLDPDHEPRKEGTVKNMKHSPSVVEIGGMGSMKSVINGTGSTVIGRLGYNGGASCQNRQSGGVRKS